MEIFNHTALALHYAVHSSAGVVIAAAAIAPGSSSVVPAADPAQHYRLEVRRAEPAGCHVEPRVPGDARVDLGPPAAPQDTVQYGQSSYSLFLVGASQYLSWKSGFGIWAYLYSSPLAISFSSAAGASGSVLNGDVLQVGADTAAGLSSYLNGRGVGDWTVSWINFNFTPSTWDFQIALTSAAPIGQPLSVGDEVVLLSTDPSWFGNAVMQHSEEPSYLTLDTPSSSAVMTFQIQTSSGGTTASESDIKPAVPPADTRREPSSLAIRVTRPAGRST